MNYRYGYSKEFKGNKNLNDILMIDNKRIYEYKYLKSGILFNPIVANEITANTRCKLFNDSYKKQNHIINYQTDSIISDKKPM